MDTGTGHLVSAEHMELMRRLVPEQAERYTEVPAELEKAARAKLAGSNQAAVSLTSGGKLSRWAARVRHNVEAGRAKR